MSETGFEVLLPKAAPKVSTKTRWATVTQASPLRVKLDGDPAALPFAPGSLVDGLGTDDRVLMSLDHGIPTVLGALGGKLPPELLALIDRVDDLEAGDYTYDASYGHSLRLPDGTQFCWIRQTVTDQAISTAYGSLYQGSRDWSYARSFAYTPTVLCSEFKWGSSASWGTVAGVSTDYASLRGLDAFSRATGTSCTISAVAVGRWK